MEVIVFYWTKWTIARKNEQKVSKKTRNKVSRLGKTGFNIKFFVLSLLVISLKCVHAALNILENCTCFLKKIDLMKWIVDC